MARRRRARGCQACGVCCELYGNRLRATPGDLERWQREGRADLLARVGDRGAIWCDSVTGERLDDCPFLAREGPDRARCRIHATKPRICRDYPTAAHGRRCVRGIRFEG